MPPQGMPHPTEPDYVAFTSWLAGSLDRAWVGRSSPGRYVVHRLNRTEYGNAIRDLLALDIDVTELLPSDGANFGFDNIAASLNTSPLLLERYLTAAQRISALAVGDPDVVPGTVEYSISREFTQNGHVDGLPLGTRGGTVVRHVFPADGEYKLSGRLVRGVEEGYAGVEGNDLPHTFVITIDGAEVYSAQVGGLKDHEVQAKDMNEARTLVDARMTGRVTVTAGPHDVGFTWRERPSQPQDVWQPSLRDSQEVHMIGGQTRLQTVGIEGPYGVTGVSATPSRDLIFVCQPAGGRRRSSRAPPGSSPTWRAAPTGGRSRQRMSRRRSRSTSSRARAAATSTRAFAPGSRVSWPARRSCIESNAIPPACGQAPRTRSATWSSPRACRSFSGAAFPDETLLNLATHRPASRAWRARGRRCAA